MLHWIAKTFLNNKIASDRKLHKQKSLCWDKTEKIALILDKNDNINKSEMDKLLESTKKYIDVFFIETGSKTATYADWTCLLKADKSFMGLPKGTFVEKLKTKPYDVVINTCAEDNLYAAAIATYLPAQCKCSSGGYYNVGDLMIHRPSTDTSTSYLNQVIGYLKMIRV